MLYKDFSAGELSIYSSRDTIGLYTSRGSKENLLETLRILASLECVKNTISITRKRIIQILQDTLMHTQSWTSQDFLNGKTYKDLKKKAYCRILLQETYVGT